MSKKKNERASQKWMCYGNFQLCRESNSLGESLCVSDVAGQWRIRWREDTYIYAVLTRLMEDEKCSGYVQALLTLFYAATNYPHDFAAVAETHEIPFIDGFCKLMKEQTERELAFHGEATEEQDEAVLKEVGEMQDIMDELEQIEKAGDDTE